MATSADTQSLAFLEIGAMTPALSYRPLSKSDLICQESSHVGQRGLCAYPGAIVLASWAKLSTFAACPVLAAPFMVPRIPLATNTYVGTATAPADRTPKTVPLCFCGLSSNTVARGGQVYAASIPALQVMEGRSTTVIDHVEQPCTLWRHQQTYHGPSVQCRLKLHLSQRASRRWPQQLRCSQLQAPKTTP